MFPPSIQPQLRTSFTHLPDWSYCFVLRTTFTSYLTSSSPPSSTLTHHTRNDARSDRLWAQEHQQSWVRSFSFTRRLWTDIYGSYLHSRMAIVRVGQQKKEYGVHQALICDKSNFFKKALTGSFAEARTGIVPLEDVSAPLFTIFVSWLYVGRLIYVAPPDSGKTIQDDFSSLICKENDEQQEYRSIEDQGIHAPARKCP